MIYVIHDQMEAMTLADRIVVLRAGRIEQVGAPLDLYDDPDNLFVAGFLGSPRMNFLPATVEPDGRLRPDGAPADLPSPIAGLTPGRRVILGCRPENVELADDGPLAATVRTIEHLGASTFVHADCAGTPIAAELHQRWGLKGRESVRFNLPVGATQVFDAETGVRIRGVRWSALPVPLCVACRSCALRRRVALLALGISKALSLSAIRVPVEMHAFVSELGGWAGAG